MLSVLSAQGNATASDVAAAARLGRSTAGKMLVKLERAGKARRSKATNRAQGGPLEPRPDGPPSQAHAATERLRPGQLDWLVLDYLHKHAGDALSATAIAAALGRSAGRVGNCLRRLAATERVRQVNQHPRGYTAQQEA